VASVVLPKEPLLFDGTEIKDSKKFTSKNKKKIREEADYIKSHALYWNVAYVEAGDIDRYNILQSTMKGMHECIQKTVEKLGGDHSRFVAIVDGNYFKPYSYYDENLQTVQQLRHETVVEGDAKMMGIAAASILAKTERDKYIEECCKTTPELETQYGLHTNMGYGTKGHLEGIRTYGLTEHHRKTYRLSTL
jgi:ribonuclease HII